MSLKYNMMRWSVSAKPLNVDEWNPECESTRSKRLSTMKSSAPFLPSAQHYSIQHGVFDGTSKNLVDKYITTVSNG